MKKISILAIYAPDNYIEKYIIKLAEEIRKNVNYQILVVNGNLSDEQIKSAYDFADKIILRANDGFDIAGYRQAFIDNYESIKKYDQVIFYNQSIFGPFYPLKEMFDTMDKRDVDFWGITRHLGNKANPTWASHIGYVPSHLQSYFLAVNKKMFLSTEFYNYFDNLKNIHTYNDAVGKFEIEFTRHFEALGYKSSAYINAEEYTRISDYPLMSNPVELIKNKRCPIAKRKSFIFERNYYPTVYNGNAAQRLYEYLNKKNDYDFKLIFNNLIKTIDLHTLTYSFTPCYFIDNTDITKSDTIIFVWLNSDIQIQYIKTKLDKIKKYVQINILTNKPNIISIFNDYNCILTDDGYSYVIKQISDNLILHKYIGYITNDIDFITQDGYDLSTLYNSLETILCIDNNIKILNENKILGVLSNFSAYSGQNFYKNFEWKSYRKEVQKIFNNYVPNFPIGSELSPICNAGMFFAKTQAITLPYNLYNDMEILLYKSVSLKTKDIIIPLAAQINMYMSGILFEPQGMATDLLNLDSMLRKTKKIAQAKADISYDTFIESLKNKIRHYNNNHTHMTLNQAYTSKLKLKEKLYIIYHLLFNKPE